MSKRSTTEAGTAPARRSFGLPRLADMRIRSKLGLILIVPVVALLGVATIRLVDSSGEAFKAGDTASLAQFTQSSSALLNALQEERAQAAVQLYKDDIALGKDAESVENFNKARGETDAAIKKFRAERGNLADDSAVLLQTLEDIDSAIVYDLNGFKSKTGADQWDFLDKPVNPDKPDGARGRISNGAGGAGDLSGYNAAISFLQTVYEYALDGTTEPTLSRDLRATQLVAAADENSEKLRLLMLNMDSQGTLSSEKIRQFNQLVAARDQSLIDFSQVMASVDDTDKHYEDAPRLTSPDDNDVLVADDFEDDVIGKGPEDSILVDHTDLQRAFDKRHDASRDFITKVQEKSAEDASDYSGAVITQVLIEIAALLVTLVVAVLLALAIARKLVQSLRRLREGALEVAHVDLPRAVAAMRQADPASQRTPAQVVAELGDPLRMDNRDEVGTVAGAFNTVHREAVRIAAEQAALRSSVSTMFVNLARRSQGLVDQLIGHLDRLERGEQDPDRLGELFQLDHLATRMRRNDENLLVLAGADSTRVERDPAQIGDVLRAAQSEVLSYTRIEFGTILADREVQAGAINDIVHLIAELLDNATGYSPPDSAVVAEARQTGEQIFVRIIDRGIGMSHEQMDELNRQLAERTDVDISASRLMGLVVVAKLAQRHNITVTLSGERGRGTIAEVVLPTELLTDASRRGGGRSSLPPSPTPRANGTPAPAPEPVAPAAGDGPRGLFEPLNLPEPEQVEPFSPGGNGHKDFEPAAFDGGNGNGNGSTGLAFHPGDNDADNLPRRKLMEVTGEIVAEVPDDPMSVALPMIRLDAAPLTETPVDDPNAPPSWPSAAGPTSEPIAASARMPEIDETMELPIFREVESAWFKSSTPPPRPAGEDNPRAVDSGPPAPAPTAEAATAGLPQRPQPSPRRKPRPAEPAEPVEPAAGPAGLPQRGTPAEPAESSLWHTAADSGWQVAAEVVEKPADEVTGAGLPKRRAGERLVPGSVDTPADSATDIPKPRRDPEGVRGLLSAYHRGVQRGRGNDAR